MSGNPNRRSFLFGVTTLALPLGPSIARAQSRTIWSVREAYDALRSGRAVLIDVRSRAEWRDTGVGTGVWPISMHEDRFSERLFAAKALAGDLPVGLICATGGRSASIMRALRRAGYDGYVDVSEGMLGSRQGPGWIAEGLPIVSLDAALAALPARLA